MFTGLVQQVGEVARREPLGQGLSFAVRAPELAPELEEGESVAVDGVCQTVTGTGDGLFAFESVQETLRKTTLGELEPGRRVNLERSLAVGDRMGGHFVQGHVDGTATVRRVERAEESVYLEVELPAEVARCTVGGGSLALDGVSLTVQSLREEVAEVAIVPYTWAHTSLDRLDAGDRVNVEADLIGKYVARLVTPYSDAPSAASEPTRDHNDGPR